MLEDRLLLFRFKCGSPGALQRIYEKYRDYLLRIACGLLHNTAAAEDIVHDVFLRFAQSATQISLKGNLKAFLRLCVLNAARDEQRKAKVRFSDGCQDIENLDSSVRTPDQWLILNEQSSWIENALWQIPVEQREVVVLHLCGEMTFRQIAAASDQPIATIRSRYRYGLEKLRSILDREVVQ